MKWGVIGHGAYYKKYEILCEYLKIKGIDNQLEIVDVAPEEVNGEWLSELKGKFDQIRIESPFGHQAFTIIKEHEASMILLRSADTFFCENNRWWLRSATFHAMCSLLNQQKQNLDLEGTVLIVGVGAAARAAIAALVKVGFQEFNIANKYEQEGLEFISELQRIYFGVRFHFVSQEQLVLLPGSNSIMVNATPFTPSNDLLQELYYFNFLKKNGMVWEMVISPLTTPLIKEAEQVGAKVQKGYEISALADKFWLTWVQPRFRYEQADYLQFMRQHIDPEESGSTENLD